MRFTDHLGPVLPVGDIRTMANVLSLERVSAALG
jgi:hypothetical protein